MIAPKNEAIAGAFEDGLHASTVGLDAGRGRVVKTAAMDRSPEVGVELEVGAPPFVAHRAKDSFEVCLGAGVCPIENVPGAMTPTAESHAVRPQRCSAGVLDEPIGVRLEEL